MKYSLVVIALAAVFFVTIALLLHIVPLPGESGASAALLKIYTLGR